MRRRFCLFAAVLMLLLSLCHAAMAITTTCTLPELASFADGVGSVYQTAQIAKADYVTRHYLCLTQDVETIVQEYIRELRKFDIYISKSEKDVYNSVNNAASYGIALKAKDKNWGRFSLEDSSRNWSFADVSVYITFSTGGTFSDTKTIEISYARDGYKIADTGARIRKDRSFNPSDYYFYRDQLKTEAQKEAYDIMLPQLERMDSPVSLEGMSTHIQWDDLFWAWYSVLIDNPQDFMAENHGIHWYNVTPYDDEAIRLLKVDYFFNRQELASMKDEYEQAVAEALKVIDPYMTDYEKELALHNWMCDHIQYDYDETLGTTSSYFAMVKRKAVCEGYAEAFTDLLHRAGIESATVYGDVFPEENFKRPQHAWNLVRIDGEWYYVDVTWDDLNPGIRYDYFNITTEQISKDHRNGELEYPLCTCTDAAYHE